MRSNVELLMIPSDPWYVLTIKNQINAQAVAVNIADKAH